MVENIKAVKNPFRWAVRKFYSSAHKIVIKAQYELYYNSTFRGLEISLGSVLISTLENLNIQETTGT